jgi:5'-3' exonuclease
MGIPVYFKTLVSEYSDTILHKDKYNDINSLFFDLNCLIHPSVRGLTDEDEMITKILSDITKLIEYTGVKKLVYIAIDGIAPKGKMKQQRQRRFKSALERKYSSDNSWNTNAISPGTYFMSKLNEALNAFIKTLKIKTILSDSDERGEGEHKILHYIKTNDLNNKVCIYGLDADLIMLSLVSGSEDIVLLRERTEYNIEKTENDYIYLKIDPLKDHIIQSLDIHGSNKEQIINDYIFICFLLGNDFMNHIPSLNLRYGGHDLLLRIYSELQKRYQGYFQLIDYEQPDLLHMTFFKEFIQEISLKEKETMRKIFLIRDRQSKKIHNQYYNDFKNVKEYLRESHQGESQITDKRLSLEDIYRYQRDSLSDPEDNKKMIENLPILYSFGERKEYNEMKYSDKLCEDYMKSLLWTTHYYFDKCCDWRFSSVYNEAPLTEHLFRYITDHKVDLDHNDNEFSNYEQLSYIFPQDSHHLHKHDIISKDYQMIINLSFHRYLWECEIDFI